MLEYDLFAGKFTWKVSIGSNTKQGQVAGYVNTHGYRVIGLWGEKHYAHRLAYLYVTGKFPEFPVDHINGLRDDNRLTNLRLCRYGVNAHNLPKTSNNSSGFVGVRRNKNGKRWISSIATNYKEKYLGTFDTSEQARVAYVAAKKELHAMYAGRDE